MSLEGPFEVLLSVGGEIDLSTRRNSKPSRIRHVIDRLRSNGEDTSRCGADDAF
ncbi:hypothetical protein [Kibdelosporangium philippinense]|uniref:hypothetical protein n=1 Tax=Kibdelosporangium philippinense TaxID=211113 RepID=UPI00361CC263